MKRLCFIFLITINLTFLIFNRQVYADSIEATNIELNTEYSDRLSNGIVYCENKSRNLLCESDA
jgi:hypothetical protein